ncbi:MAG: hypothetical protein WAL91_13045 [Propionicimonas sp.]
MNREFRAQQQAARERQVVLARWNRYRRRASYLILFTILCCLFWAFLLTRH